uniref:Prolactin, gene 2 n=1 Tax=Xenopus tropicalis TaxID=8364 RepID=A0A803J795_XENTR
MNFLTWTLCELTDALVTPYGSTVLPGPPVFGQIHEQLSHLLAKYPGGQGPGFAEHDDLINLVQKLLRSWNQPLQHLALEAPDNMASKVKEVEEHAKILQGGIDRIAGRMQSNLGDDFYPQWFGPLDPRMPKGDSESYALYHLLHCFRRDSNKIDNYLKILRCRMVHASNC